MSESGRASGEKRGTERKWTNKKRLYAFDRIHMWVCVSVSVWYTEKRQSPNLRLGHFHLLVISLDGWCCSSTWLCIACTEHDVCVCVQCMGMHAHMDLCGCYMSDSYTATGRLNFAKDIFQQMEKLLWKQARIRSSFVSRGVQFWYFLFPVALSWLCEPPHTQADGSNMNGMCTTPCNVWFIVPGGFNQPINIMKSALDGERASRKAFMKLVALGHISAECERSRPPYGMDCAWNKSRSNRTNAIISAARNFFPHFARDRKTLPTPMLLPIIYLRFAGLLAQTICRTQRFCCGWMVGHNDFAGVRLLGSKGRGSTEQLWLETWCMNNIRDDWAEPK